MWAVSSSDRPVAGSGKPPSPSAERRTILVVPGTARLRISARSIEGEPPAGAESSTIGPGDPRPPVPLGGRRRPAHVTEPPDVVLSRQRYSGPGGMACVMTVHVRMLAAV